MVTLRVVGRCAGAGCPAPLLLQQTQWAGIGAADRRILHTELRLSERKGRGLCVRCYRRADRAGELIDHERQRIHAADLADDYTTIRDELPTGASARRRYEAAAERLNKSRHHPIHPDSIRYALRVTDTPT